MDSPSALKPLKGLKIIQLNCCSLISKIDEIRLTLVSCSEFHILCITESWFKPYHSSELFNIPNYVLVRLDCTRTSRNGAFIHGGGVACYIRDDLIYQELEFNHSTVDLELLTLSLLLPDLRKYYLCIVYRPPSGNYSIAINKLKDVISSLKEGRL